MSTTTEENALPEAADGHAVDEHVHEHPSDWMYVKVALFLAVLTALEVGTYFIELESWVIGSLFVMMIIKFVTVIFYFMHLKYDNPIFKRVFVFGLVLAIAVYVIALTAFEFWDSDSFFRFLRPD